MQILQENWATATEKAENEREFLLAALHKREDAIHGFQQSLAALLPPLHPVHEHNAMMLTLGSPQKTDQKNATGGDGL